MTTLSHLSGFDVEPFPVSRVSVIRPLVWLWRGVGDLRHSPGASLAYGLMVSVMGAIILGFWHHPYLIAGSITGFLLVGPLLTAGLCELSRRRAAGESVDFDASLSVLGRHREALVRFAAGLLIVGALWFAVSTLILGLALGSAGPSVSGTLWGGVLDQMTLAQAVAYVVIGGSLAAAVFAGSVVSVPLIIDRDVDAPTAISTSRRVLLDDIPAMIVWSVLIVTLVAIGFATYLVGMVVVFPLLGHATWHAYRDLVR
ncbi:DUF2189 domain-containing protein [uncultured Thiodictyon sp.]|uniref:DUF2189 domain-containing protein n=1 Tax=uncultured Thiodictyon sp. TaxID=1846217 RepID=UPI0025F9F4A3|nr:DUF2189 domain-containing protein [uncultured Thiodictyon sp.]